MRGRDTPDVHGAGRRFHNRDAATAKEGAERPEALGPCIRSYATCGEKFVRESPGAPEFRNDLAGI